MLRDFKAVPLRDAGNSEKCDLSKGMRGDKWQL